MLLFKLKDHNCVKELRELIQKQKQEMNEMQQDLTACKYVINDIKDEVHVLKVTFLFLLCISLLSKGILLA